MLDDIYYLPCSFIQMTDTKSKASAQVSKSLAMDQIKISKGFFEKGGKCFNFI